MTFQLQLRTAVGRLLRVFPLYGLLLSDQTPEASAQSSGILERLPASTLKFQNRTAVGYQFVNAFGTNTFAQAICIASPPGETNRIFVAEKHGLIEVVPDLSAANLTRRIYLNLQTNLSTAAEQGLLGLAFHPAFAANGYFFVYRSAIVYTNGSSITTERLSRFQAKPPNALTADEASEVVLFDQIDRSVIHNGGDLHFGRDGYLYISVGDGGGGGGGGDPDNTQTIRKGFTSGILRIDVDKKPANLVPNMPSSQSQLIISDNYFVPNDNPFVTDPFIYERFPDISTNSIRTEFWATGFRNPWRFSIDSVTDWVLVGDVGDFGGEEIDLATKGGDYGWLLAQGGIPPIFQYYRTCVIGGLIYRGTRIPELSGAYVFCDYVDGNVWSFRYNGSNVTDFQNLQQDGGALTESGIVSFGADPRNGDILVADLNNNTVKRLVYEQTTTIFPATIAETGIFSDVAHRVPAPGFVSYELNIPHWSDASAVSRWFAVPNTNSVIAWDATGNWSFPQGTLWVQHFELFTNSALTPIETRVLVKQGEGVQGASYRWNGRSDNASLVSEQGLNDFYVIVRSTTRNLNWRFPSRSECTSCHSARGGFALGFNTAQLNCSHTYSAFAGASGSRDNQLHTLAQAGFFDRPIGNPTNLPALAFWTNSAVSIESRVRSFLAANCAHCHQTSGSTSGYWDARYSVPTIDSSIVWGPLNNNFGDAGAYVITPRALSTSMLYQRLLGAVGQRMPPYFTSTLETNMINLVAQWIGILNDAQPLRISIAPVSGSTELLLQWSATLNSVDLYTTTDLARPTWLLYSNSPALSNAHWFITVPTSTSGRFYKLQNSSR